MSTSDQIDPLILPVYQQDSEDWCSAPQDKKTIGYDHELFCPRCEKGYETDADGIRHKQASYCASRICAQRARSIEHYMVSFDGPPAQEIIPINEAFIQTYYGSRHDGQYFRFTDKAHTKRAIGTLAMIFPWIKDDACICDDCIDDLISKELLEYAGDS